MAGDSKCRLIGLTKSSFKKRPFSTSPIFRHAMESSHAKTAEILHPNPRTPHPTPHTPTPPVPPPDPQTPSPPQVPQTPQPKLHTPQPGPEETLQHRLRDGIGVGDWGLWLHESRAMHERVDFITERIYDIHSPLWNWSLFFRNWTNGSSSLWATSIYHRHLSGRTLS